jgi:hypothetical protein
MTCGPFMTPDDKRLEQLVLDVEDRPADELEQRLVELTDLYRRSRDPVVRQTYREVHRRWVAALTRRRPPATPGRELAQPPREEADGPGSERS